MKDIPTTMYKGNGRIKKSSKDSEAELYFRRTDGTFSNSHFIDSSPETDQKPLAIHHRPRVPRKNEVGDLQSKLNTAFDPIRDLHMWTMWRTAVNGRIVDEVKRLEKAKAENAMDIHLTGPNKRLSIGMPTHYSKTLSGAPPLSRFIRLDDHSKYIAQSLVREGQGQLKTSQFIYFGLPRVVVDSNRCTIQEQQHPVPHDVGAEDPKPITSISQFSL